MYKCTHISELSSGSPALQPAKQAIFVWCAVLRLSECPLGDAGALCFMYQAIRATGRLQTNIAGHVGLVAALCPNVLVH